ncbi:glycosyltransferase [Paenibacillus phytohabitans]|uniref:glycosyltransferase n=1 Tax=Paenibacillus phytohabitans TaxID=2654978 RepID=UPI001491A483|nr:glycosyltransferase [Paenibacillus phytohabitans]
MESILILLSTYNGANYLETQLKSLYSQKNVNINILVRDDGSTDGTHMILERWEKRGLLSWYTGRNLKPALSFMDLVFSAPPYKYYAFCDQDDVWEPDKLNIAIERLKKLPNDKEALYCSALNIVDEQLKFLKIKKIENIYSLGEALIRNNIVGCTMVLNKKLVDSLREHLPKYIEMHDSWIYKVCLVIGGNIIVDNLSYINYRQHTGNVVGARNGYMKKIKFRIKLLLTNKENKSLKTSKELLDGYSEKISISDRELLLKVLQYKNSIKSKLSLIKDDRMKFKKVRHKIFFLIDVFFERF